MPHAGIVLELDSNHVIVLDKEGRFQRIPRQAEMEIGMEVRWTVEQRVLTAEPRRTAHRPAWKTPVWRRAGAAAIAACLVAAAGIWFALSAFTPTAAEAYAMVSLDINPSVSMQVGKDLKVKDVKGINADGTQLLNQVHVKGQSLQSAISILVNAAVEHHMMPNQDAILVTAAPGVPGVDVSSIETRAKDSVEEAISSSQTAQQLHPTVYALNLSSTVWKAAKDANVSPGKFAAYLVAGQEGVHVSGVNQMTGPELSKVLSNANGTSLNQLLNVDDAKQLAKLIQSLQTTDVIVADSGDKNSQGQSGSKQPPQGNGPKPGKGNGKGSSTSSGHDGNKHSQPGTATLQLGGTTITIPLGNATPVVTGKEPEGNQGQDNQGEDQQGDHQGDGEEDHHGDHHGDHQDGNGSDNAQGQDNHSDHAQVHGYSWTYGGSGANDLGFNLDSTFDFR